MAHVVTAYVEGDVIRHTEIFAPLRALEPPVGHIVTVLEEMGTFGDDSEPSFERRLAERLDSRAPGICSEAERWTRVPHEGGPRSLPRQEGTLWLYLNGARPALVEWSGLYDHLREVTPAARLILALAAARAARVAQIGTVMLDDVDIGNRRPTAGPGCRPPPPGGLRPLPCTARTGCGVGAGGIPRKIPSPGSRASRLRALS